MQTITIGAAFDALQARGAGRETAETLIDAFDFGFRPGESGQDGAYTAGSDFGMRGLTVDHYRLEGEAPHDHGHGHGEGHGGGCGCFGCVTEQEGPGQLEVVLDAVGAALQADVSAAAELAFDIAAPFVAEMSALLTSYTSGLGNYGGFTSDFNIEIVFIGDWTEALQEAFISSAEYLSYLIQGDLDDAGAIDDVRIEATLEPIDGSGGVLGRAGPTDFRVFQGFIPSEGIMEFDVADAEDFDDDGLFDDIVTHEMLHVLGVGTLWELQGDTSGSIGGDDLIYTGFNSRVAYNVNERDVARDDPNSRDGVPIETDGGPGTAGGHWDDDLFEDELMTGFISNTNYVSSMTVANLEDLGYDTIWNWRDPRADFLQPDEFVGIFG